MIYTFLYIYISINQYNVKKLNDKIEKIMLMHFNFYDDFLGLK